MGDYPLMSVFDALEYTGHELILHCRLGDTGHHAIIAIHDSTLGPALGGCRMWPYATDDAALTDVLRLSRGMTYKNALADLPLGGGKSVIIGDPATDRSPELWIAFAESVAALGGRYWTAQDVGLDMEDVVSVARHTQWVGGFDRATGKGRDPSRMTALGILHGIRAAVAHRLGRDTLEGVRVLVQGVGHVGELVCRHLKEAGARVFVSDINAERARSLAEALDAEVVAADAAYDTEAEVYSPCALGATLNEHTIPRLRVPIVAGAANNQLSVPEAAQWLASRDILYAPDYVINAGGVIDVGREAIEGATQPDTEARVVGIYDRLMQIFEAAAASGRTTAEVADGIVLERIGHSPLAKKRGPPPPRSG